MKKKTALLFDNDRYEPGRASGWAGHGQIRCVKKEGIIAVAAASESIRGMISFILEDAGHKCIQASDRSELYNILESEPVVLAVIDIVPPEFETPPVSSKYPPIMLLLESGQVPGEIWKGANVLSLVIKPFSSGQILSSAGYALFGARRSL